MSAFLGLALYLAPGAFALWCIRRLRRNERPSWFYQWQRAWGWLALCAAPAPLLQCLRGLFGSSRGLAALAEQLTILPGSWYVQLGGQSVVSIFEAHVKTWTGHRRDTMLDNAAVFFGLVLLQAGLASLLVTWRLRRGAPLRDPLVLATGAFTAVNALLAASWPWYGT